MPVHMLLAHKKRRKNPLPIYGIIASLFLVAQVMGIAHAAEHGDQDHHHDEIPCAIQFAVDTARSLVAPPPQPALTQPVAASVQPKWPASWVYQSDHTPNRFIRGPPSLLF